MPFAGAGDSLEWEARRAQQVVQAAQQIVESQAITDHQRHLLSCATESLVTSADAADWFSAEVVMLPLYVYGAMHGDDAPTLPLAAALSLLEVGIHLLDDIIDRDVRADFTGFSPAEVLVAAVGLIAAVPQLVISQLEGPAATIAQMESTLATGLVRVGAGQQRDLRSSGSPAPNFQSAYRCASEKGGERQATYAVLAAQLAGASPAVTDAFATLGRSLGIAQQIRSDCYDLFVAPASSDLAHATRSLPVALHLGAQRGSHRIEFLKLLSQARHQPSAQLAVRQRLLTYGVPTQCAFLVDLECARAREALAVVGAREPWRRRLEELIGRHAFCARSN